MNCGEANNRGITVLIHRQVTSCPADNGARETQVRQARISISPPITRYCAHQMSDLQPSAHSRTLNSDDKSSRKLPDVGLAGTAAVSAHVRRTNVCIGADDQSGTQTARAWRRQSTLALRTARIHRCPVTSDADRENAGLSLRWSLP